jgi:hypothetical protein
MQLCDNTATFLFVFDVAHPKAYLFLKSIRELMTLVPQSAVYRQLEVSLDITSSSSSKVKLSVQF